MPTVPTYDSLQVSPNTVQGHIATPDLHSELVGRNSMQAGHDILHISNVLDKIEEDANQTRVMEAKTKLMQHDMMSKLGDGKSGGWSNITGADVFKMENSKPLTENVLESRQKMIDDISGSLGNDRQREMFAQYAMQSGMQVQGELISHEIKQHEVYKSGVLSAGIDTEMRNMGNYFNDPTRLAESSKSIVEMSKELGKLTKGSEEVGIATGRKLVSNAYANTFDLALAQGDHASAGRILKEFSKDMDMNDLTSRWKMLTNAAEASRSQQVADSVIAMNLPRINPGMGDQLSNLVSAVGRQESGNRHFDSTGKVTQSDHGAIGEMQVLESTAKDAAQRSGVPWDKELFYRGKTGDAAKDKEAADYNRQLGSAYLKTLLNRYDGSIEMALAAYNGGMGRVDAAIKESEKTGRPWLEHMPEETRKYVPSVMKAFATGQGMPQKPTEAELKLMAREQLGPNASPELVKKTEDRISSLYKDQVEAVKQQQDAAVSDAFNYIRQNRVERFDDLPVDIQNRVNPKDINSVNEFAKKYLHAEVETDKALYNQFITNPASLAKMTDDQWNRFALKFSDSDYKELSKLRAKSMGIGGEQNGPGDLNYDAVNRIVNQRLSVLNINPNPKKDDDKANARLGAIRQSVSEMLLTQQAESGKKFNDAELTSQIDQLFMKNESFKRSFLGIKWTDSNRIMATETKDIPSEERDTIIKQLEASGLPDPTDAEILHLYLMKKLNNG